MSKDVAKTQELEHNGKAYAVDVLKNSQWRKVKMLEEIGILDLIPANGENLKLYQGCDRLAKFTQKVKHWRYEIKNIFGITLNPLWFGEKPKGQELADSNHETVHDDNDGTETKDVLIAKAMFKLLGAKLLPLGKRGQRGKQVQIYEVVRDYKSDYEKGKRVYFDIVPWGGDNRYQVFDYWLNRDTEYQEKQNVSTSDTVSTFLYKDIKKSEYQYVNTEKVNTAAAIAFNPEYDNDEWEDIPDPESIEKPVMAIAQGKPELKAGDKVRYIGKRCQAVYGGDRVLTITTRNGFEFTCERPDTGTFTTWIKSNELAIA